MNDCIQHATSLDGVNVGREVILFASAVPSLVALVARGVKVLRVLASSVDDWGSLAALDGIEELEINFCQLGDGAAFAKLPSLRRLKLFGVPLDAATYDSLATRPLTDGDAREEWELNRALAERGLGLCYSELGIGPLIVRPGLPRRGGRVDALNSYAGRLKKALDSGATGDALFTGAGYADEPLREDGPSMFMAHWERGDAADARAWIAAAAVDDADRRDFERFVARFSSLSFIRERSHLHAREEKLRNAGIPMPLKRARSEVIATVERPHRRMTVQFDGYDFPLAEHARDRWYDIGLVGYYSNSLRAVMNEWAHLYPIGFGTEGYEQITGFGMPTAGDDARIWEYSERNLYSEHKANSKFIPIYPAFRSWASLLGHVCAVRVDGREIAASG